MPAPSAMPRTPETACVRGSRATIRQSARTTDGTSAASTDRGTSWVNAQTIENTVIGRIDSASPRGPPMTACTENCSAMACLKPAGSSRGAGRVLWSSGMRLRHQLVSGVEDGAMAVVLTDHAMDAQPATGFDAGDVPPAEPDDVEAAGAVVELGLQRRDPGPGPQGHRPQGAADRGGAAQGQGGDRRAAGPDRQHLLLLGVHLVLRRDEPRQRLAPAPSLGPLLDAHASSVRRRHRISVISGPRGKGSSGGRPSGSGDGAGAASGSRSGSSSRGAIASVPRTTTTSRTTDSSSAAAAGSCAAGPWNTARRNQRGPSTPAKRCTWWPVRPSAVRTGSRTTSSGPNRPSTSVAVPP